MKIWKSNKKPVKEGIWVSEIRLRDANASRLSKVNKLLNYFKHEGINESVS